jgi:hypothetical protein
LTVPCGTGGARSATNSILRVETEVAAARNAIESRVCWAGGDNNAGGRHTSTVVEDITGVADASN